MWKRNLKFLAGAVLFLYVAAYALLSLMGGYVICESGRFRPFAHLASYDAIFWMPRVGEAYVFIDVSGSRTLRAEGIGYFFFPLILLDQAFVHKTRFFILPDANMNPSFVPPTREEIHPNLREQFDKVMNGKAQKDKTEEAGP